MRFSIVLAFLFFNSIIYSQTIDVNALFNESSQKGIIEGIVLDSEVENKPFPLVEIIVKNTGTSTSTDLNGAFSIQLKPGTYTLVYSFIGYKTIESSLIRVTSNNVSTYKQTLHPLTYEHLLNSEINQ